MNLFSVKYLTENPDLIQKVESFINAWKNDNLYIETKTSGSTGKPKIILLEKELMRVSALITGEYFQFKPSEKIVLCLSPDTIGGKMLMLRAILHEMELVVVDVKRNPLEQIDFNIDFVAMAPMQIQTVIKENPEKLNLVKNLLIGGAAVSPLLEAELKPFDTNAYESFGMTETMSHIAVRKLNQKEKSPFQALKGIRFSLNKDKLVIHAPELGLPELDTNDIVELVNEQSFFWKGRADFAINSGGIKFHPEEIEKKLATILTNRYFITSERDALLGEKMVLIIEGKATDFSAENIFEHLKQKLSSYEIPKNIYFVPEFTETASGKINRLETRTKISNLQP